MTKSDAIKEAKKRGLKSVIVYFDPIGNREEWESESESWGYCEPSSIEVCARFRQKDKDLLIK
tara:strand:+ start:222 stop:410 length:189 start_codon:yes stop_codon:yes gene_type:complete